MVPGNTEGKAGSHTSLEVGFLPLDLLKVDQGYERMRGIKSVSTVLARATGNMGLRLPYIR